MPKQTGSTAFKITLSALACALAVIFLSVGAFNAYLLFACYALAEVALMLPLSKLYLGGGALAYIGCVILTLLLGAFAKIWLLAPFIVFFGLHPLVNALQLKFNINRWLALIIKIIWFDLTCWLALYVVFGGTLGDGEGIFKLLNRYIWAVIIVGGSAFAFIYDYAMFSCQTLINALVYRIKRG